MEEKRYKKSKIIIISLLIIALSLIPLLAYGTESKENNLSGLKDGYYKVPLKLWHAQEDRASMGNGAIVQEGEIEIDQGKLLLYIGADKMEVMSITASLINLYYQNPEGDYLPADRGSFEIEVAGEHEKRPSVLRFPIEKIEQYYNVMVDPKVEPMGDAPIGARIKLETDKVEKIEEEDSVLIDKFKNGPQKSKFDPSSSGVRTDKTMVLEYPAGAFEKDFTFYANKLVGDKEKEYRQNFDSLTTVEFYNFECLGDLKIIKKDQDDIQESREKYQPKKAVKITIPLKAIKSTDNPVLYSIGQAGKEKIDFEIKDEKISFQTDKLGDFAIEASQQTLADTEQEGKPNQTISKEVEGQEQRPKMTSQPKANIKTKKVSKAPTAKAGPRQELSSSTQTATIAQPGNQGQALGKNTNIKQSPGMGQAFTAPEVVQTAQASNGQGENPNNYIDTENSLNQSKEPVENPLIIFLGLALMLALISGSIIAIKKNMELIYSLQEEESYLKSIRQVGNYEE